MSFLPLTQRLSPEEPARSDPPEDDQRCYLISNGVQYEIGIGETKIGRDASACSIVFENETLSKVHAVLESEGAEDTYIYDAGSTNKTKIGKVVLKPHCRYKMTDNDVITLGSVIATYKVVRRKMKMISVSPMSSPKTSELGESFTCLDEVNSPVQSSPKDDLGYSRAGKYATDMLESPSTSFLMRPLRLKKKHYYVRNNSSQSDIFSMETQPHGASLIDESKTDKDSFGIPCVNDEIFNLTTQCDYVGAAKEEEEGFYVKNEFSVNKSAKSVKCHFPNVEDCNLDDSGTFDFVKKDNFVKYSLIRGYGSYDGDIFSCTTQCQVRADEGNRVGASTVDELNFKNKITSGTSPRSRSVNDFGKGDGDVKVNVKREAGDRGDSDCNATAFLSDGEDDELCELMDINSPTICLMGSPPADAGADDSKVEKARGSLEGTEIFDMPTQVESVRASSELPAEDERLWDPARAAVNDSSGAIRGNGAGACANVCGDPTRVDSVAARERDSEQEGGTSDNERGIRGCNDGGAGDGKMNQNPDNVEPGNRPEEEMDERLSDGEGEQLDIFREATDPEDDISTQIFQCSQYADKIEPNPVAGVTPPSEDAHRNGETFLGGENAGEEANGDGIAREDGGGGSRNGFESSDSGDETESDLEIKLCIPPTLKVEPSGGATDPSSASAVNPDGSADPVEAECRRRSSSGSSDRTVSDLDATEARGGSRSVLHSGNSESNEDFIATQIFPVEGENDRVRRESNSSDDSTVSDLEILSAKSADGADEGNSEDFIATQLLPQASPSNPTEGPDGSGNNQITVRVDEVEHATENDYDPLRNPGEVRTAEGVGRIKPIPAETEVASENGEIRAELSPTLMTSHPLFDESSAVGTDDGMNGTGSCDGSGTAMKETVRRNGNGKGGHTDASSESEETDCEELLEAARGATSGGAGVATPSEIRRRGSFPSLPEYVRDWDEMSVELNSTPELRKYLEEVNPSPSVSAGNDSLQEERRPRERSARGRSTASGRSWKPSRKITSYYEPSAAPGGDVSPLKRLVLSSPGEVVPKKRSKGSVRPETKGAMRADDREAVEMAAPKGPRTRSRVLRNNSEPEANPMKTPAREKANRLISEVDLRNIIYASEVRGSECKSREEARGRTRTSSVKKASAAPPVETAEEDNLKWNLRPRRSNSDRSSIGSESGRRGTKQSAGERRKSTSKTAAKVVFTGFESETHNRIIAKLGGEKVNDLREGSVLVTDRVRRTVKFLSAVATGLPIVSPKWLTSSEKASEFLDPWDYLLSDKDAEERWMFNLKATLKKSRRQKLLRGYSVFATESTKPPVPQILDIVSCCGGIPLTSSPGTWPEKSIVLTCIEDRKWWPPSSQRHIKVVHYEFLLIGVLRHFPDFKTYKLR